MHPEMHTLRQLKVEINDKVMTITPKIVALGKHQLFLGISWLRRLNPDVDWQKPTLRWRYEKSPTLRLAKVNIPNSINNLYHEINVKSNTSQKLVHEFDKTKKESDPLRQYQRSFTHFSKYSTKSNQKNYR